MAQRIEKRVEVDAETATGGTFSPYNPSYLKWKKTKRGFLGNDKNFSLSRDMWKGFQPIASSKSGNIITATLGGAWDSSWNKIQWNSEREGRSIIDASKAEEDAQAVYLQKWLDDFLSKYL